MQSVSAVLQSPHVNRMLNALVALLVVVGLGMLGFSPRQSVELMQACNVSLE
jgi:hypothetical protein